MSVIEPTVYPTDGVSNDSVDSVSVEEENKKQREWIRRAADVCEEAAKGNLERRLLDVDVDPNSDLGRIIHGINSLLDYTDAFVRESKAALDHAARGKFFRRVVLRGMTGTFKHASEIINSATQEMETQALNLESAKSERLAMADDFNSTVKDVTSIVASASTQMYATSQSLSHAAQQTSSQSAIAVEAAKDATHNVHSTVQSTGYLSEAVSRIEQNVSKSTRASTAAVAEAKQASELIVKLQESSTNIGGVMRLISDIAKQTNLLALNATIEAARAGEAGRGFAIVASEVKELSRQTDSATKRVDEEIRAIKVATEETVDAIAQISATIDQFNEVNNVISKTVDEQAHAASEIDQNVGVVLQRTNEVTENIDSVAKTAEDTSHAAEELVTASNELSRQSELLTGEVDRFMAKMRQ